MATPIAGPEIERLIQLLARLPGLGPRSARRAALHLIRKREHLLGPLAEAMRLAHERVSVCTVCGSVDTRDPCTICADARRDPGLIVVVENVGDLWALERAHVHGGRYHVLGGTLSALGGTGPEDLFLAPLLERVRTGAVREVILALGATVDGATTAHWLSERLAQFGDVVISRVGQGVPIGGALDTLDDGTLAAALRARRPG